MQESLLSNHHSHLNMFPVKWRVSEVGSASPQGYIPLREREKTSHHLLCSVGPPILSKMVWYPNRSPNSDPSVGGTARDFLDYQKIFQSNQVSKSTMWGDTGPIFLSRWAGQSLWRQRNNQLPLLRSKTSPSGKEPACRDQSVWCFVVTAPPTHAPKMAQWKDCVPYGGLPFLKINKQRFPQSDPNSIVEEGSTS